MSDYNKPYILLSVIQISSGHSKKELKNVVFILELLKIKNEGILTLNQQMQLFMSLHPESFAYYTKPKSK